MAVDQDLQTPGSLPKLSSGIFFFLSRLIQTIESETF